MAGGSIPKVLALLLKLLRLEGARLLGGEGGEDEEGDPAGTGGCFQVCLVLQCPFLVFAWQICQTSEHLLPHIGVAPAGFHDPLIFSSTRVFVSGFHSAASGGEPGLNLWKHLDSACSQGHRLAEHEEFHLPVVLLLLLRRPLHHHLVPGSHPAGLCHPSQELPLLSSQDLRPRLYA